MNGKHRQLAGMALAAWFICSTGCSGSKPVPTEGPTEPQRPAGPRRFIPKVDRGAALAQFHNLGLAYLNYVDTTGRPPAKLEDLRKFGASDPQVAKALADGLYRIYWDVDLRHLPQEPSNTLLGYVFDVPDKGGAVLMCDGSSREMTPDEFRQAARPPGKQ